jgi:hypothetical protein
MFLGTPSTCHTFVEYHVNYEIEIKMPKKSILNVWGRRLVDATGERRPPKTARTKHILKRSIRRGLRDALGTRLEMLLAFFMDKWIVQAESSSKIFSIFIRTPHIK